MGNDRRSAKVTEDQLNKILALLTRFMKGDFEPRLPVEDPDSVLDAIHLALNITGEELQNQKEAADAQRHALADSERKFRTMGDAAHDAMLLMDSRGCIVYWNAAATRIFGWSEQEALGQPVHTLLSPERYHKQSGAGIAAFGATGSGPVVGKTIELMAVHRDGAEFPMELSLSSAFIGGGWYAIGIVRDITDRRQMQRALVRSRDELQQKVDQLEKARAQIRDLQGLLPICMHCKNVRDDEDTWQRVDHYLARHTDAQFTHGLCPDCLEKHYPKEAPRLRR